MLRLTAAWIKWALGVAIAGIAYCFLAGGPVGLVWFLVVFLPALLLDFLGVAELHGLLKAVEVGFAVAVLGLAYGCAIWVTQKPKVCRQCGCVSARLWE